MEQQGNGGHKLSPEFLARVEAALDSERRQRELLERRLRDTERSLETALAAVSAPHGPEADLLQLKSQLAVEVAAQAARATLELNLLELELVANAEAEAAATPAFSGPQRIIQYVNVPEAAPEPDAPVVDPAQAGPKDFEDKLAAAQMAIDAAEARASHNAVQVRKLTEELASARAEQIRLSAAMSGLRDRFDASPTMVSPFTKAAAPLPLVESPALLEAVPGEAEAADVIEELAAALFEAPAKQEPAPVESANEVANLEDALQAWGEFGESNEQSGVAEDLALEDALAAWGDTAATEIAKAEPESAPLAEDSLLAVLEGWGEAPTATSPEAVELLEGEDDPPSLGASLEVDSLERLDTPDAPAEQRLAEALGDEVYPDSAEPVEVLEDLEPATLDVEEPEHRWEPEPVQREDEDELVLEEFAVPEPAERFHIEEAEEEVDTQVPEYLDIDPEVEEGEAEQPATKEPTSVIEALDAAESIRRPISPPPRVETESAPIEDFEPDYAAFARRPPEGRREQESPTRGTRVGARKSMIDALQQFIGE